MSFAEQWLERLLENRANKDWRPLLYAKEAGQIGKHAVLADPELPADMVEVRSMDDQVDPITKKPVEEPLFRAGDVMAHYTGPL